MAADANAAGGDEGFGVSGGNTCRTTRRHLALAWWTFWPTKSEGLR